MQTSNLVFGIVIGFLFVCLLVLFCILLVKLYIQKINNYNQLIYQKDIDFQITLNATILETQEQVLQNISQDLHDDAGQQLTAINFQIENLKLNDTDMQQALSPLSESVQQLSQSIRSISHSLSYQLVMQQDVLKAIANEITRLQKNKRVVFEFRLVEHEHKKFSTNENLVIYRIFQEIINNILKHSKATLVDVELKTNPCFEMIIHDNGVGFNPADSSETLGLRNVFSRAEMIRYTIDIQSKPHQGTTVILSEKQQ